jgi:hypothetical protein
MIEPHCLIKRTIDRDCCGTTSRLAKNGFIGPADKPRARADRPALSPQAVLSPAAFLVAAGHVRGLRCRTDW